MFESIVIHEQRYVPHSLWTCHAVADFIVAPRDAEDGVVV